LPWLLSQFFLCFLSSFAFAEEESAQNPSFSSDRMLAAGELTPEYSGFHLSRSATDQQVEKKDPTWSLGAGVGVVPDYEVSEDIRPFHFCLFGQVGVQVDMCNFWQTR
jgi:hypothetical protein